MRPLATAAAAMSLCAAPSAAEALPSFAVLSARACDNCHVDPVGWDNPSLDARKCSLNCSTCHVNPTGGGMRKAAGRYYGKEVLPLFGFRPSASAEPLVLDLSSGAASRPAPPGPAAGSAARYAGADPTPFFQFGADVRAMAYFPQAEGSDASFFPMQTDLYLALSPYNPDEYNRGRLTLLVNGAALGNREDAFDKFYDRFFLKEYYALLHDLPYQLYAKAGQFIPAFGWRLADHTSFVRQDQTFNNERQVTGLEVGLNPNYLYANASIYVNGPLSNRDLAGDRNRFSVLDFDGGFGAAATVGYRDFFWQAGASFMFESRDERSDMWAGVNWSLNFHEAVHQWKPIEWLPLTYLGELDVRRTSLSGGRTVTGLAAMHQFDLLVLEGLFAQIRYDWIDPDIERVDDHRHRYTVGAALHPYTHFEIIVQGRWNVESAELINNEGLVQAHFWF